MCSSRRKKSFTLSLKISLPNRADPMSLKSFHSMRPTSRSAESSWRRCVLSWRIIKLRCMPTSLKLTESIRESSRPRTFTSNFVSTSLALFRKLMRMLTAIPTSRCKFLRDMAKVRWSMTSNSCISNSKWCSSSKCRCRRSKSSRCSSSHNLPNRLHKIT